MLLLGGLGDLFKDNSEDIKARTADLDPETKQLIGEVSDRALRDREQFEKDANVGVDAAAAQGGFGSTLTGAESGMSQAIANKYKAKAGADVERLKTQNNLDSHMKKADALNTAMATQRAKRNVEIGMYERQIKAQQAREAARGQMLANILGMAGMAAGAAVGGPAGAGVGANVGKMAGGGDRDMTQYTAGQNKYGNMV